MVSNYTIREDLDRQVQFLGDGRQVEISCVACGYHDYKDMWDLNRAMASPQSTSETNLHDKYAVVVRSAEAKQKKSGTFAEGDIQEVLSVHSPWRYNLAVAIHR